MGQFKDLTLEEKSYIYGLLITDGTMYVKNAETYTGQVQLEVSKKDEDIVDKLNSIISHSTKRERVRNTNFKENHRSAIFAISRQSFIKDLIDFGFPLENKTINARPPITDYDKDAFWRGVIDGDGSIGLCRRSHSEETYAFLSLTTKSEILKNEFCKYVKFITGKELHPNRNKRDDIYNITITSSICIKILKEIYKNATIYLDRKYNKYLECLEWKQLQELPKVKSPKPRKKKIVTEKTKEKLRIRAKERFQRPEDNPMYGKHHTVESRQKISEASRKRWEDEEYRKRVSANRKGMNNGINNPNARQIVQLTTDGIFMKHWGCIKEAADFYNINESCIRACCNGKQKTSCGFKWMYKEDYDEWISNSVS